MDPQGKVQDDPNLNLQGDQEARQFVGELNNGIIEYVAYQEERRLPSMAEIAQP
jgi:hypothetical protein